MNYEAEIVLKKPTWAQCSFNGIITITKSMFYDFDVELTFLSYDGEILENHWGKCFVKEHVADEVVSWLKDKDFYLTAFKGENGCTIHMLHFINEEDRLHYLLKFVSKR